MLYNFNITDTTDDEAMKLYKKMNKISFINVHKGIITILLSTLCYIMLSLFVSNFFFLKLILSITFSLFIISFYESILNESGTCKKLSKVLKCSAFIKKIAIKENHNDEEINGVQIPAIDIYYDLNNDNNDTAVLVRIRDGRYKILSILDKKTDNKEQKATISSLKLKEALLELDDIENLIFLNICQLKETKNVNEYVSERDLDVRSLVTEMFLIQRG